jgi:hypothetical protein
MKALQRIFEKEIFWSPKIVSITKGNIRTYKATQMGAHEDMLRVKRAKHTSIKAIMVS